MSDTTTDFLSGQGVPVALHDLEAELFRLWGPATEQAGGPAVDNPNVTRVVLTNLVIFAKQSDAPRLLGVFDTVASRYPSRTIVLQRTEGLGRKIETEVSALCHLPALGQTPVCSERILLRFGAEASDLLPGAVRPILEPELPFVLWWTDDPRNDEALYVDLADECTRLILDLPDLDTNTAALRLGLDPKHCPHARDTAWFGLFRWRELIAQFFDPPCHLATITKIVSVKFEVAVPGEPTAIPPRLAVWLAAWFAGQLGWKPIGKPDRQVGVLKATFENGGGAIALEIVTDSSNEPNDDVARLRATTITTLATDGMGPGLFRLSRPSLHDPEVRVEIDSSTYCSLPKTVLAPQPDHARRVAAALESSRNDPPFKNAIPHAFWLLDG